MYSRTLASLLILCSCSLAALAEDDLGIRAPEGFRVSLYADDTLAHDIYSMTIDAQGRVVVAGAGYVKTLHDDDSDGRADRATMFSNRPASGAHGMCFDGPDLICTGDNSVMRLRDTDGDGAADGEPEVWTALRHPEHGANGIVRGPDGCYWLICGNDAGVSEKQITLASSPVKHPRSGAVVRFSPDGKPLEVFAHGFRNPYDLDFDAAGRLFTVDADGERDHHLPWYAATRLFDVAQGAEHGWLLMGWMRGWNRPPSFFDSVERAAEIGRGSPTGLVVYRHHAFPERYRGGVFSACWSLGKIYHLPLTPSAGTVRAKVETFLETTGDVGFAPCDIAVGPAGDLFVAIGGRRTRGSVFRVQATGAAPLDKPEQPLDLLGILNADQPLASWSRARWLPAARELGEKVFEQAAEDGKFSVGERVRAIEIVVELCGGADHQWAARVAKSEAPPIRARIAWALGRAAFQEPAQEVLARLAADADPEVARAAWEALALADELEVDDQAQPDWKGALTSRARRVRSAAIFVGQGPGAGSYLNWRSGFAKNAQGAGTSSALRVALDLADIRIRLAKDAAEPTTFPAADLQTCGRAFAAAGSNVSLKLEAVRLLELGLGDVRTREGQAEVYSGYVGNLADQVDPAERAKLSAALAPVFPTTDSELNRELARLLGMLSADQPGLFAAIAGQWSAASAVEDDVHYLIVASLLPGPRSAEVTRATATAILGLHAKLDALEQFASRNWPLRVSETFVELTARDPNLAPALVESPAFGRADHTLFVDKLPSDLRATATRKLWAACQRDGNTPTNQLVSLAGRLPADEARKLLVDQWEEVELRDSIVLALARHPVPEDRAKFVEALASPQSLVVERASQALVALGVNCSSAEIGTALRALKQTCSVPKQTEPRRSLLKLLNYWTEECSDVDEDPDPSRVWVGWYQLFENYYPAAAAELNRSTVGDAAAWKERLAEVPWDSGDAARGKAVFERRACNRCHEVAGHLGPELKGAVTRFNRDDLFTAIVDPNLEVSPAYQTTVIATNSGQVYHGLVVYESPEITLLQTGPDTTVRILNTDQSSANRGTQSLMPTGLLDTLSDEDLGDLYAYLRTLAAKP